MIKLTFEEDGRKYSVEMPEDYCYGLTEVVEDLFIPLMVASGYGREHVEDELFGKCPNCDYYRTVKGIPLVGCKPLCEDKIDG